MKNVFIGLLLAVVYSASLGLENRYIPPVLPEHTLQSLEEYTGQDDGVLPAHTLDQDGYRYQVGRRIRYKREALVSATPATFASLYADSKDITQNLPDSNFLGPSPDEIAVPSSDTRKDDYYPSSLPDQIARSASDDENLSQNQNSRSILGAPTLSVLQPFQQAFIESAILADDGYHYKTGQLGTI